MVKISIKRKVKEIVAEIPRRKFFHNLHDKRDDVVEDVPKEVKKAKK